MFQHVIVKIPCKAMINGITDHPELGTPDYEKALAAGYVEIISPYNSYIDTIIRAVNMDAIRSRGLKIVLDPMYGVSRTVVFFMVSASSEE